MFILYALVIGIVVGFLAGGRPMGLANLHLAWAPLMLAGLLLQVALFSDAVVIVAAMRTPALPAGAPAH